MAIANSPSHTQRDPETAVGYVRYSTDAQDPAPDADTVEDLFEDDRTASDVRDYCDTQGYLLEDIYKDVLTGRRADRVEYMSLLNRIGKGNVDVLVMWEVSRIGRDEGISSAWLAAKARAADVRVETVTGEEYDFDRPGDRLQFRVMTAIAEYEVDVIRYRTTEGRRSAAELGFWPCGHPPAGYDLTGKTGRKVCVPNENAPLVVEVFERYADGQSQREISEWLSDDHAGAMPTSRASVSNMVDNLVYRGYISWNDEWFDGAHEAIISESLWSQAQAMRDTKHAVYNGVWDRERPGVTS